MRFQKSSLVTKLLVLVLVVYATVTLVRLQDQLTAKKAEAAQMSQELDAIEQENQRLEQAIDALDTDEGIAAVARQKLGMINRNQIVFYDVGN